MDRLADQSVAKRSRRAEVDGSLGEPGRLVCRTAQRVIEALKTECHFKVTGLAKGSIYERRGRVV